MSQLYTALGPILSKCVADPSERQKYLDDATAALKADGVDIGAATASVEWTDSTNTLHVSVENGGANWNGSLILSIKK